MNTVTLILFSALLAGALYQGINILMSKPVNAELIDYEEQDYFDPELGQETKSFLPVYRYPFNGGTRTFRSVVGAPFPFLRRNTHRVFVRADGKVFELEGVIACVILAAVVFILG